MSGIERPRLYSRSSSSSNANSRRSTSRIRSRTRRSSSNNRITAPSPLLGLYNSDEYAIETDVLNTSLDNTLPLDYFKQDILAVIHSLRIPKWRRIDKQHYRELQLDRISGALTNCVYKLTYKNYYPLLLRLYGDVENIIDRDSELNTLTRLSRQNIGPKLLGCFTNGRFEEFLNNSITLNKEQIRERKISRMIARRMKELHNGISLIFDEKISGPKSWILIEKWVSIVEKMLQNSTIQQQIDVFILPWEDFKKAIFLYKKWLYGKYDSLDTLNDKVKFCHNDTQYGNLLFYNKSERLPMEEEDDDITEDITLNNVEANSIVDLTNKTGDLSLSNLKTQSSSTSEITLPIVIDTTFQYDTRLTVIDFEYAGPNIPAYDISNHFSEWMYNYHDPNYSYRTDETRYPSKEQRLNLLISYVQYVPGSSTPNLGPSSSNSISTNVKSSRSRSVVNMKEIDLPPKVVELYNETIYWRSVSSIFWALWGVINKGSIINEPIITNFTENSSTGHGPNGETYRFTVENDVTMDSSSDKEEDYFEGNTDDDFDHLKYSLGKIGVVIGDLVQFGILSEDDIAPSMQKDIKYLDAEFLIGKN